MLLSTVCSRAKRSAVASSEEDEDADDEGEALGATASAGGGGTSHALEAVPAAEEDDDGDLDLGLSDDEIGAPAPCHPQCALLADSAGLYACRACHLQVTTPSRPKLRRRPQQWRLLEDGDAQL